MKICYHRDRKQGLQQMTEDHWLITTDRLTSVWCRFTITRLKKSVTWTLFYQCLFCRIFSIYLSRPHSLTFFFSTQKSTRTWSLLWRVKLKSRCCNTNTQTWSKKWETSTKASNDCVDWATRALQKTVVSTHCWITKQNQLENTDFIRKWHI